MRFLFVLNISFDVPGPSVHLMKSIIDSGVKAGHTVDVILKTNILENTRLENDKNSKINYHYILEKSVSKSNFVCRYLEEVNYAKSAYDIIDKKIKYDSVFIQSTNAALFYVKKFRKLKAKIVFNVQDIFPYNLHLSNQLPFDFVSFKIFKFLQHLAYKKSDEIITIGPDMRQTLISDGVPENKIYTIYNWSYADDLITLDNLENVKDYIADKNVFNVVYAGNIGKMQNVEIIAKTAKILEEYSDIKFYIIGNGANLQNVKEITNNSTNVSILDPVPSSYAESIYAQADVNIIPLAKNGIKTALPSKTATSLRTNKSILFCFDDDSLFKAETKGLDGVYFSDINEQQIAKTILKIKEDNLSLIDRTEFVKENMSSKNNPLMYIKHLEG